MRCYEHLAVRSHRQVSLKSVFFVLFLFRLSKCLFPFMSTNNLFIFNSCFVVSLTLYGVELTWN